MHVLFVHSNFPAQFGHIAARLVDKGWECTFVSETEPGADKGIRKIRYAPDGTVPVGAYRLSRVFENDARHAAGIYNALKGLRESLHPDLIVGHAGLGPTLFLADLYPDVPIINYFEDFYTPRRIYRAEWPPSEQDLLRWRAQDAMTLLHLEFCTAGYTPTRFQHGLLPDAYRDKVRVIHDGIDTEFWRARRPREGFGLPRVVTYVSRTFDPLRGFDIFMKVAKRIYEAFPDVTFIVAGTDGDGYGDELGQISERTFREHVLNQDDYDLRRFQFVGWVPPEALVQILAMSDLHIYLTAPLVVSWSLLNAMACGCVVLASDTPPVGEIVEDGYNGLVRAFGDVDGLTAAAVEVLRDPGVFRPLGEQAERTIAERFSLEVTLPRLETLFSECRQDEEPPPA